MQYHNRLNAVPFRLDINNEAFLTKYIFFVLEYIIIFYLC